MSGIWYHVAPKSARTIIEREGLRPHLPASNPRWRNNDLERQPQGIYLWDNLLSARLCLLGSAEKYDLWSVNIPEDRNPPVTDPLIEGHAALSLAAITPQQLDLICL